MWKKNTPDADKVIQNQKDKVCAGMSLIGNVQFYF